MINVNKIALERFVIKTSHLCDHKPVLHACHIVTNIRLENSWISGHVHCSSIWLMRGKKLDEIFIATEDLVCVYLCFRG